MRQSMGFWVALASSSALAHDGHGLAGSHWHASDTLGFVVLAVALGVLLWATRRK